MINKAGGAGYQVTAYTQNVFFGPLSVLGSP
jgi:hypothetical protein